MQIRLKPYLHTLASVSVYSHKMSVIFMFWSINQFNAHKMNSNSLFMKTSRALRVETQTKKHFIEFAEHVWQNELTGKSMLWL